MAQSGSAVLDAYDRAILGALQRDNAVPLRELASQVHLSIASVQRRIKQLTSAGFISRNTAVLDPDRLGQVITLIVEVQADSTQMQDLRAMKQAFSGPEIQQCYYVTGTFDFLLVLTVANMGEFQALADRLFHQNPNVKSFRTTVALERVKATLDICVAAPD